MAKRQAAKQRPVKRASVDRQILKAVEGIAERLEENGGKFEAILEKLEEIRKQLPDEPSLFEVEEKLGGILRELKKEEGP
jgi:hypothetical protein